MGCEDGGIAAVPLSTGTQQSIARSRGLVGGELDAATEERWQVSRARHSNGGEMAGLEISAPNLLLHCARCAGELSRRRTLLLVNMSRGLVVVS